MISQVLIVSLFFAAGLQKAANFDKTVTGLVERAPYVPFPRRTIGAVVLLELIAPIVVAAEPLTGARSRRVAVALLAAFTVAATAIYHPPEVRSYNLPLLKNAAVVGGLLLLLR